MQVTMLISKSPEKDTYISLCMAHKNTAQTQQAYSETFLEQVAQVQGTNKREEKWKRNHG